MTSRYEMTKHFINQHDSHGEKYFMGIQQPPTHQE